MTQKISFVEIANKIIEERGGDEYKESWLRAWLSQPENEDKMMQAIMMKELSAEMSRKGKIDKNANVKTKVEL
ncbi:MAG: hypothetical protein MJZ20_02860 [Bacteroidaceae bacterium]|nr:hypothetical protein [Bacteroidaceae bacterium]